MISLTSLALYTPIRPGFCGRLVHTKQYDTLALALVVSLYTRRRDPTIFLRSTLELEVC